MQSARDKPICLARICSPHGIRGEVSVECYIEDPEEITKYNPLLSEDGAEYTLKLRAQKSGGRFIASIKGVLTRNDAEKLNGIRLYIPRARLPKLTAGNVYFSDIIGLDAVTHDGKKIGTIIAAHNFGAGDVLELRFESSGKTEFFPYTADVFSEIDVENNCIKFTPPEVM